MSKCTFRTTTAALCGLFMLALSAQPLSAAPPTDVRNGVVLFVAKTFSNPYFREMRDGIQAAIQSDTRIRAEMTAGTKEDDVSGQRAIIESYLARASGAGGYNLVGIILAPAASNTELTDLIRRMNDMRIPIVVLDTAIAPSALSRDQAHITSFIGSSNIDGGRLAANMIAARVPRGGKILLLNGVPGQSTAADRRAGFLSRLSEIRQQHGPAYEVREWTANWTQSEALVATSSILSSGDKIDAIFGANDQMALGAAEAVRSSPRPLAFQPVIVGFDAIPEARDAVQKGTLSATIAQDPKTMGAKAIAVLEATWNGSPVQPVYTIPVKPVVRR
ncbi:MAG TPA: sugar ABC transporter substrate-binding protein [Rhizomicrobium sp.]|nr:sugar ABC transporter substrate-binding protein [Rhizomicrobium sp.]